MLNDDREERRLYLSAFYTRPGLLGAYSRNLSERLMEYITEQPDHPLSGALREAAARGDSQVLRVFGAGHMIGDGGPPPEPPTNPFDFMRSLVSSGGVRGVAVRRKVDVAQATKDAPQAEMTYLVHLSAVQALLASWGCDEPAALTGLFHSVYSTAAFDHLSVPIDAEHRAIVRERIGAEAERVAFVSGAVECGSLDAALPGLRAALASAGADSDRVRAALQDATLAYRAGVEDHGPLVLESPREWQMLLAVQLADWLIQADGVDTSGFGHLRGNWGTFFFPVATRLGDHTRMPYAQAGQPGSWVWEEGGARAFRAEAFETMLDLLTLLKDACATCGVQAVDAGADVQLATAARVAHTLLHERLGQTGAACRWEPDPSAARL